MTGDVPDIVSRIWSVLPRNWFAYDGSNINALITSISTPWSWLYMFTRYIVKQSRISTATDLWLDLIAWDYFGNRFGRKPDEADAVYLGRIKMALLREGVTRSAISSTLDALTGSPPEIFEPANCLDTGSYGVFSVDGGVSAMGLVYSQLGGWGSLNMPLQFFLTATRPPTPGVAMLAGYGDANGAYGAGQSSYVALAQLPGQLTDVDIQTTLHSLLPVNTTAWLQII